MEKWQYWIVDKDSHVILKAAGGLKSESDAKLQGEMEAKADNLKNYYIMARPYQTDI